VSHGPAGALALGERELVAITGAGGKSTLMLALARQLAEDGKRVLVTTTTKMGPAQVADLPCICEEADRDMINPALDSYGLCALITGRDDRKVTGPAPEVIDDLYRTTAVDYLLVEADGARGRSLKAPASHEPMIPATATMAVVLMGVDAVGGHIADVAHRPQQAAVLTGKRIDERLTIDDCVAVLTHPQGGLQGVPIAARVVIALTKADTPERAATAERLARSLDTHPRISQVVVR
jgi:molybdenum cofactor cytidylyltransferase